MSTSRRLLSASLLASALLAGPLARPDLASALAQLRAIGPEGQGNAAASRAWTEVTHAPAASLPDILQALDDAGDRSRNYLVAAALALADRQLAQGHPLPVVPLGTILLDPARPPRTRRLAYDLLERADRALATDLLPGLLDDPAPELRRDAVQRLIDNAARAFADQRPQAATILYEQALGFARDADQIEAITGPLKDLGRPVDLVCQLGFLTRWHVIGPFDNTAGAGFERVFPPETEVRLDAEYPGKEGPVRWRDFRSPHEHGKVDFNQAIARLKEVAGYGFTEFHSPRTQPAELRLACKNGWKIWFNGRLLFGRDEYHRGAELDQYRLPVELQAGRNTVLVKLTQNEQQEDWTIEWEFQLRITDPSGRVLRSEPSATPTPSTPSAPSR